jgi:hypothetical protein
VQLSVRTIKLEWKRRAGANEDERELLDYLDEHEDELGLELPTAMMGYVGNLRTHEPEDFRDIIRLQYRCDELKMQISRLCIKIFPDKKTGDETNGLEVYDLIDGDLFQIFTNNINSRALTGNYASFRSTDAGIITMSLWHHGEHTVFDPRRGVSLTGNQPPYPIRRH